MIKPAYLEVLHRICNRLSRSEVNWMVVGTTSLALQGMAIEEPEDIDIQTDRVGAYEIERLCSEWVTRKVTFSSTNRIRSHFGDLLIDGIKVELMGDLQHQREDGEWEDLPDQRYKQVVKIEGTKVPIPPLEYEYEGYLMLGRTESAEMVRKFLENKNDL